MRLVRQVVVPKSVTPARVRENIDIFDFTLDADDLAAIGRLDRGDRTGPDPDGGEKPPGFSSMGGRWVTERTAEKATDRPPFAACSRVGVAIL